MKEREVFHIREDKQSKSARDSGYSSRWRVLPWYFLLVLLVLVGAIALFVYWQEGSTAGNIITPNESDAPKVMQGEVSGVKMMDKIPERSNDERVNILLLGSGGTNHAGGGLTDVIQILSLNPKKDKAFIFSIPRDLYVEIDGYGHHKINTMYVYGQRSGHGQGGALAKREAGKVLGIPIHYYAKIDFQSFVELVDLVDGLDICVDQAISDPQHETYISTGCQHMTGQQVLAYVRSRYTTSDFDRSRRQQKTLLALKEKLFKLNFLLNPIKINQAFNILAGNFNTDIRVTEMKKLAGLFKDLNQKDIDSYVIDNRKDKLLYSTTRHGAYVLLPYGGDFSKIHKLVEEKLP